MRTQRAIEASLARRRGMSDAAQAALTAANDTAEWYGRCGLCKKELRGTLTKVREHKCEGSDGQ